MDTRLENSDPPVLVAYRNHQLSYKLMTGQVVLCLLLQMLYGDNSGRKRFKVEWYPRIRGFGRKSHFLKTARL